MGPESIVMILINFELWCKSKLMRNLCMHISGSCVRAHNMLVDEWYSWASNQERGELLEDQYDALYLLNKADRNAMDMSMWFNSIKFTDIFRQWTDNPALVSISDEERKIRLSLAAHPLRRFIRRVTF